MLSSLLQPQKRQYIDYRELPSQISNAAFQTGSISFSASGRDLVNPARISDSIHNAVIEISIGLSRSLIQKTVELSQLKNGWDGENAEAVKTYILADALDLVRRLSYRSDYTEPFLVPTFDGFVQIEWYSKKRLLEFQAVENGWLVAGTEIGIGGRRAYFTAECGRNDFDALGKFYAWFSGVELLWPL